MARKYPEMAYHNNKVPFSGLVGYSVLKGKDWVHEKANACYWNLTYGSKVAVQLRIPVSVGAPDATWRRISSVLRITNGDPLSNEMKEELIRVSRRWFEFVMDKERSPWRSVNAGACLVGGKRGYTGVYVHDCNVNRAMLHNMFIALRWAWEQPQELLRWGEMLDVGLDPTSAMFYTMRASADNSKKERIIGNSGLSHTYMSMSSKPSLWCLFNPRLDYPDLNKSKFSSPKTVPVRSNFIWTGEGLKTIAPLPDILDEFSDLPGFKSEKPTRWINQTVNVLPYPVFLKHVVARAAQRLDYETYLIIKD